jgi:hypothetical protein
MISNASYVLKVELIVDPYLLVRHLDGFRSWRGKRMLHRTEGIKEFMIARSLRDKLVKTPRPHSATCKHLFKSLSHVYVLHTNIPTFPSPNKTVETSSYLHIYICSLSNRNRH